MKGLKRSKEQIDQEASYLFQRCAELKKQVEEREAIIKLIVRAASVIEAELAAVKKLVDEDVPF